MKYDYIQPLFFPPTSLVSTTILLPTTCLLIPLFYLLFLFLADNPLRLINVVHMGIGVESSNGAWEIYQCPHIKKRMIFPPPKLSTANSYSLRGGAWSSAFV